MIFKVFNKTGEYKDENGDWDGDIGEEVEFELSDEEVHRAIVDLIYDDYISCALDSGYNSDMKETQKLIKARINFLITDLEAWDKAIECYSVDLQNLAEEEYADELCEV